MLRLATISVRGYAIKKPAGTSAPSMQSQKLKRTAITDPEKLATYCCGSNIKQEGEDIKLGADEDYPEWLWNLRIGPYPELHELDKDTEEYWYQLSKVSVE